ncbi:MAG: DUF4493 domain-containing protein [Alistipes sp.]|nr:DUF4493 domain-containing protein [Alistipes sp.]
MKKLLYILACVAVMFTSACSKGDDYSHEGKGSVSFVFPVTRAALSDEELKEVLDMLKVRIYSHSNGEKRLVRLYTYNELTEMGDLWLLAGQYSISAEGGVKSPASFDDIYYFGSETFTVVAGQNTNKTITIRPKNTLIKVEFDQSVLDKMQNPTTIVAIDDEFNVENIASGEVPYLTYTSTSVGYFTIEEGQTSLAWNFSGVVPSKDNAQVEKSGIYTPEGGFKEGYQYTIKFKYSADLPGYIYLSVTVNKDEDSKDDIISFKPEPQITGDALRVTTPVYEGMADVVLNVKAISDISSLKIKLGAEEFTYVNGGDNSAIANYLSISQATEGSDLEWNVSLHEDLLCKAKAGEQTMVITAFDSESVEAEADVKLCGEGVFVNDVNKWQGTATVKPYINTPNATNKKLYYRQNGGEWNSIELSETDTERLYTATFTFNGGDNEFEYYFGFNDSRQSDVMSFTTSNIQIPNGDMETWSGELPLCPYNGSPIENTSVTWDTGNHGSKKASVNVTTNKEGARPGSTGRYYAHLQSIKASVMGMGKFAAGNIFYGRYMETEGTNGRIGFGQEFDFECKPKALRVWYKGQVGVCDNTGGPVTSTSMSDKAQIFIWLCNWTKRHEVTTADSNTFVSPEDASTDEGNIVGYGVWSREIIAGEDDGSDKGWQELIIPITYREGEGFSGVKPNMLVISCASSAYGDFFAGSTASYMDVDDFEFIY